ncbi:hypothetical protein QJQ45_018999 [Haematococcus lacustris]|nr:hypothetical protein QJQ45_018999 [Haematococcus lacustris]
MAEGLQTRGRVAAFAGPSLALPRVLQHNVIGLGNATPLQPNGKRRRTTTADTAAGTTAGAATSSPRSSWITTQWRAAAEGRGNCLHCGEDRSMNNIMRLKNHLLKCPQFLDSPAAQEAAGRCKEVKAAIARRQEGEPAVTQQAVELTEQEQFGEDVMRLAIDNNWSFHFVEHATTQAFFKKWLPHLKLPSRWELSGPLLLGLYVKVLTEVKALVARCRYVTLIIDGWSKSLGSAHLLGVCAGLANQATVFLDVISTAGLSATSELMLGEVLGVIEKHGLDNSVCALVTDTPSSMRRLWQLLETMRPLILCLGCHAHIISLFFTTEVTELPSFRQHIDQVKEVVHYFLHLQLPRELLLQHRAATAAAAATTTAATTVSVKQVELVQMSQTRFASLQDMLCSVQHNKSALRSVAISDSLGNDARSRNVIALVLNPDFWEKNEWIVDTLAPAAKLVEALQADAANLAHVHFGLMAVEDKLDKVTRSCPPAFQDDAFDLEQAWAQRMLYGHHPALCLAAVIDPNFRDKHGALLPDQMRSAEDLAARLASSNGQGDDSAAAQVISFYDRDMMNGSCTQKSLLCSHPRPHHTQLCRWEDRSAMPQPCRPGQECVYVPSKALLRKWRRGVE